MKKMIRWYIAPIINQQNIFNTYVVSCINYLCEYEMKLDNLIFKNNEQKARCQMKEQEKIKEELNKCCEKINFLEEKQKNLEREISDMTKKSDEQFYLRINSEELEN